MIVWVGRKARFDLDQIDRHHDAVCDRHDTSLDGRYTNGFVRRTAGISYRRLDYWCRNGLLGDDKATGSGYDRRFTAVDVRTAIVLARLTEHMPNVSLDQFGPLIRDWCTAADADPNEHGIAVTSTWVEHLDDVPNLGTVATIVTVPALISQASAGLGGERDPAPASSGQHGSAAVLANLSPADDAGEIEHAETTASSIAGHDHGSPRTAGRSTGTATRGAVAGDFAHTPETQLAPACSSTERRGQRDTRKVPAMTITEATPRIDNYVRVRRQFGTSKLRAVLADTAVVLAHIDEHAALLPADFYAPYLDGDNDVNLMAQSEAEMAAATRLVQAGAQPGQVKITRDDNYVRVRRQFGTVGLEAWSTREQVCTRRVTGTTTEMVPDPEYIAAAPLVPVERDVTVWDCKPWLDLVVAEESF